MKNKRIKTKHGFTIMEIIVYTALMSVVILYIVFFAINIFEAEQKSRARREVVLSLERGMNVVGETVKRSAGIYEPTSVFNNAFGQLSLITANATTDEAFGFIDFYLDDGTLFKKEEGVNPEAITSSNTFITSFRLVLVNQGSSGFPESVVIDITGENRTTDLKIRSNFQLRSAASPRAYFSLPSVSI